MTIAETKVAFATARESLEKAAHESWLNRNAIAAGLTAVVNAPMTPADVAPIVEKALDSLATVQNESFQRQLAPLFCSNARDIPTEQTTVSNALAASVSSSDMLAREWIFALAMPTLKANIPAALAKLDWPAGALSAADRAKKIAELEPRVAEADRAMQSAMADLEELIGHPWSLNAYLEKIAA